MTPLTKADIEALRSHNRDWGEISADQIDRLLDELERTREALRPFACIERSTFYDAGENEEYCIVLANALHGDNTADFTGQDIERARAVLPPEDTTT